MQQALEELDASGLRPGQTELHMSQLNSALDGIQNNYNPTKAYSSVYWTKKWYQFWRKTIKIVED